MAWVLFLAVKHKHAQDNMETLCSLISSLLVQYLNLYLTFRSRKVVCVECWTAQSGSRTDSGASREQQGIVARRHTWKLHSLLWNTRLSSYSHWQSNQIDTQTDIRHETIFSLLKPLLEILCVVHFTQLFATEHKTFKIPIWSSNRKFLYRLVVRYPLEWSKGDWHWERRPWADSNYLGNHGGEKLGQWRPGGGSKKIWWPY